MRNRVLTRADPTRTTTLRRAFAADMKRRYAAVRRALVELVVDDDAFGLSPRAPVTFHQVSKRAFAFATDARKMDAFREWLQEQVDANLLTTVGGEAGKPWTARYVESAYRKGRVRAYVDSAKAGYLKKRVPGFGEMTREEFLRSTFLQPEALHKIELVATRAFEELRGVSAAMSQTLSRDLAEGLANGWHPQKVAREMTKHLGENFRKRAQLIARTETIKAHAEGQLDTFEQLEIDKLGAQVEWATAGDPCEQCLPMEGRTFTVKESRGRIPLHPNCRCAWVPYVEPDVKAKVPLESVSRPSVPQRPPSMETRGPKEWNAYYDKYKGAKSDKRIRYDYLKQQPSGTLSPKQARFVEKYDEFWADGKHRSISPFGTKEQWKASLTNHEYRALRDWKTGSYKLRQYQLGEVTSKEQLVAQGYRQSLWTDIRWAGKQLQGAFDRAPNYAGTVWRGEAAAHSNVANLKVGSKIKWDANYSTSKNKKVAEMFMKEAGDDAVLWEIRLKTGIDTEFVTGQYIEQREVITRIGTRFQVKAVEDVKLGLQRMRKVVLEEVD